VEAICEASQRPAMRFVAVKSEDAQANAVVFRARDLLVRQNTPFINSLWGHLAEYRFIAAHETPHITFLIECVADERNSLPDSSPFAQHTGRKAARYRGARQAARSRDRSLCSGRRGCAVARDCTRRRVDHSDGFDIASSGGINLQKRT
jgi:hypothetical protein